MTGSPEPRTALTGGLVWTAGFAAPRALDVLVEGERIVDVAPPGGLDADGAAVHELDGRLLMPGFQDAHLHLGVAGSDILGCNLLDLRTPEAVLGAIAAYADAHPELPWIVGGGWDRELFPGGPRHEQLDAVVGGRPAVMGSFDRHGAWVSTAALAAAGIDRTTPDPPGGFLVRDADGEPTGMLEEEAQALVRAAAPQLTLVERTEALLAGQRHLLRLGMTSIQDAVVGTGLGMPDFHDAYCELLADGRLRLRLTTALWWDAAAGAEQLVELRRRRAQLERLAGPDRVVADTVKVMVDGAGTVFLDEAAVHAATLELDRAGFSVHYHSYGDTTTRWILDAIEAAIAANGPRPRRHQIAHLMVVAPEDLPRFARLGVTANVQGFWAGTPVPHEHFGAPAATAHPERFEYPFGRLLAAGARTAGGSDWPVTTPDPLRIALAASGAATEPGMRAELDPRDRLDPLATFTAYTTGSAFVNGREHRTGRIAPGFLADLVVVDRNVLADEAALADAVVDETWIGGIAEHMRDRAAR